MTKVQSNGIEIEYEESGTGDPLLLVMGLNGQLVDWPAGFVDELVERGFRVIRFDNRDAGLSTEMTGVPPSRFELVKDVVTHHGPPDQYLVADMAGDAIGLLDALGIERAHVVGMSMGGMIAQQIAIDAPERVLSLTSIMSTTGSQRVGKPKARLVWKYLRREPVGPEQAVENAVELFRAISGPTFDDAEFRVLAKESVARSYRPEGTARQLGAILSSPDRTAGLRELRVPTLVIHGTVDPLVNYSGGVATANAVPGARLLMFNDMGHDLPRTRWDEMADAIRANADRAR